MNHALKWAPPRLSCPGHQCAILLKPALFSSHEFWHSMTETKTLTHGKTVLSISWSVSVVVWYIFFLVKPSNYVLFVCNSFFEYFLNGIFVLIFAIIRSKPEANFASTVTWNWWQWRDPENPKRFSFPIPEFLSACVGELQFTAYVVVFCIVNSTPWSLVPFPSQSISWPKSVLRGLHKSTPLLRNH